MAEYTYHWPPGPKTLQASATITGGQLLMITGSGTVGPTTGATSAWIGVAEHDAVSGDKVVVLPVRNAMHRLTASGTVTAGDQVVPAAAGAVASLAAAAGATAGDINSARQVVGTAVTTATNGNAVDIEGK
jgi:hypothetical protein